MKIILAGGGTGGHTIPGIALAQRIENDGGSKAMFITSSREVDVHLMRRYGFRALHLAIQPFGANPMTWPRGLADGLLALRQANRAIEDFGPDAIVGLGGYVSFFPILAAKLRRLPIVLLEQNVIPGKATRWLAPFAQEIACQWQETMRHLSVKVRARVTGNPVRAEVLAGTREVAARKLGLDPEKKTLLVLGGSQGSHALNEMMIASAAGIAHLAPGLQVVHLSNKADHERVEQAYKNAGIKAAVFTFLDEMDLAYSASDVALSRAGGTTIAEMAACGIPSILVPYPFAADDHQRHNAQALADAGAAVVLEQDAFCVDLLAGLICKFLDDEGLARRMHQASLDKARPDAANAIIEKLRSFVRTKPTAINLPALDPEPVGKEQQ
ncbi:MAG TPA: undecaprenyldiphospho-muramoylpentapeptide beta-N-acetylglucosaminyltransferase [Planctomycetota bacterium]|nr:undecaprenyldiphospho-muramoylpentapeptide beta-N-acetylglucosaminyltransferase [Planctomycetota bacterium]